MDICVNSKSSSNNLMSFLFSNRTLYVPNDKIEIELSLSSIIQTELYIHGQYIFSVIVLMVFLVNVRFSADDQQTNLLKNLLSIVRLLHWNNCNYSYIFFTAICFLLFIVLLPLLVILWLVVICYRQYVHILIKRNYGSRFRGFLDGTDAIWALEDDSAKSVINVMALVEIGNENINNGSVDVLLALRKRLALRFLGEYKPFPKMFYKRCKNYGYSFWTNENDCTIEDYVRFMPDVAQFNPNGDTKIYIQNAFGALCNMPLLCDHSASWEVLVSKHHIMEYTGDSDGEKIAQVPVLFRIHHSLGDGVALLRLFLETIADRELPKKNFWSHCVRARHEIKKCLERSSSDTQLNRRMSLCIDFDEVNKLKSRFRIFVKNLNQKLYIFVTSPASIIYQGFFKQIDINSLHQKRLSGEKLVCWRFEHDDEFNLLDTMKSIKRKFQGMRFSDVLLSALAISFQQYFEAKGNKIPNAMTVVLPARIEAEGAQLKLQNKFSVALQTLPIRIKDCMKNRASRFHEKMIEVKKYSDEMRNSPDYYVNYWIMSFMTSLLPEKALTSLTESIHSTIAVSNLPGPQIVTYINGHRISNLTFWLPHRGSTGIGISILSYGCKLQLGLIADRAVIQNHNDAQRILDDAVDEIRHMAARKKYHMKRNSVGDVIDRF